jgi:hypothetical protein
MVFLRAEDAGVLRAEDTGGIRWARRVCAQVCEDVEEGTAARPR